MPQNTQFYGFNETPMAILNSIFRFLTRFFQVDIFNVFKPFKQQFDTELHFGNIKSSIQPICNGQMLL